MRFRGGSVGHKSMWTGLGVFETKSHRLPPGIGDENELDEGEGGGAESDVDENNEMDGDENESSDDDNEELEEEVGPEDGEESWEIDEVEALGFTQF